jgi:hypothetical protein
MAKHLATYVAADGSGRSRTYPFDNRNDIPHEIRVTVGDDVFRLAVVKYDVDETAPKGVAA